MRAALHWLGVAGVLGAFVADFAALLRRPSRVRIVNGSSFVFTGLALAWAAVPVAEVRPALSGLTELTVAALLAAVVVQAWARLRGRRAWDGLERRVGIGA